MLNVRTLSVDHTSTGRRVSVTADRYGVGGRLRSSAQVLVMVLLVSAGAVAQLSTDLRWADGVINSRTQVPPQDRSKLATELINRLEKYRDSNPEVGELVDTLELFSDLLQFDTGSLSQAAASAQSAQNRQDQMRRLHVWRLELLARAAVLLSPVRPDKMTVKDAQRLAEIVRYTSQALDDIRDPEIMGGKGADLTKLFTRLDGIAKLAQSIQDPQARQIVSGLRGTIGTIEKRLEGLGVSVPNPMRAFDLPAETVGALIDTTRKGIDESSAALEDVGAAINGDAAALSRITTHAKNIEQTLSPSTYGRAMIKAMADRVVDRIPFVRTLAKLIVPPAAPERSAAAAGPKVVRISPHWSAQKSLLNEDDIFECAPNPNRRAYGEVNGTDRYSVVSTVCRSAIHAGVITFEQGGRFRLRFFPFDRSWKPVSRTRSGITSDSFDWSSLGKGTFVVLRVD